MSNILSVDDVARVLADAEQYEDNPIAANRRARDAGYKVPQLCSTIVALRAQAEALAGWKP